MYMRTSQMLFMPYMHLALGSYKVQYEHVKTLDKQGVLLAVSATPVVAPITHLVLESGPKTLHRYFKHIYKQFDILEMIHMHVLWLLKNGLKIACKMGHFVSVKCFNVWGTQ